MQYKVGDVLDHGYLWGREADRGEESGRKYRPTLLLVITSNEPEKLFLFPITSKKPDDGRPFKEIPKEERKNIGLKRKCYIILDEYNEVQSDMMFDLKSTSPLGRVSYEFLVEVAKDVKAAAAIIRPRGIPRTDN
ncbi:hypothetical protein M8994_17290 [Brucella sp. 21LCYQ03]|nr:hypothetical protein [Brucella sp. 21LCYQ03]